jgi:hypothetical protein
MINNKRNNNEIWSKYYGYFKKLNNKWINPLFII